MSGVHRAHNEAVAAHLFIETAKAILKFARPGIEQNKTAIETSGIHQDDLVLVVFLGNSPLAQSFRNPITGEIPAEDSVSVGAAHRKNLEKMLRAGCPSALERLNTPCVCGSKIRGVVSSAYGALAFCPACYLEKGMIDDAAKN